MATLCSAATGNWGTASTWKLCDSTSEADGTSTSTTALTTGYQNSASFTPGAITIDAIGIRPANVTAASVLIYVALYNATDSVQVTGTEVSISLNDMPGCAATGTGQYAGGWVFFKFASSVLLEAAHNYQVQVKLGTSGTCGLYRTATAADWYRQLRTTTTQAPAAGDKIIVAGEHTGSGTGNSYTVTMNETGTTDYGTADTNSLVAAVGISKRGTLTFGTTSSTNYNLRCSGSLIVYSGGTLNVGTVATPIPRDSTAKIEFDCAADGDFGLIVRHQGSLVMQGLSRTSGKNTWSCVLNQDLAASGTTLYVDTDTGWLNGDQVMVASTSKTATESEKVTLNANATATYFTTGTGVSYAHGGTSPISAEVVLLTRNVKVTSVTSTNNTYCVVQADATACDIDWVEFSSCGVNASQKGGLEIITANAATVHYSVNHDTDQGVQFYLNASGGSHTIQYCAVANCGTTTTTSDSGFATAATSGAHTMEYCWVVGGGQATSTSYAINLGDVGSTYNYLRVAGRAATSGSYCINHGESGEEINSKTFTGFICHSNGSRGYTSVSSSEMNDCTYTDCKFWRNNSHGFATGIRTIRTLLNNFTCFGNTNASIYLQYGWRISMHNCIFAADTTFGTNYGIWVGGLFQYDVDIYDSSIGVATGIYAAHTTADLYLSATSGLLHNWRLHNTKLGSTTEIAGLSSSDVDSVVYSSDHDQVTGAFKTTYPHGIITNDTTLYKTASPSVRLDPSSSSVKLQSETKRVAIAQNGTATVSVWVRESVSGDGEDYTGARARLRVRRNDRMGYVDADSTLDTATVSSEGAWEELSGVTSSASADGVFEFYVDCDGTAGWVNVDDWTVA